MNFRRVSSCATGECASSHCCAAGKRVQPGSGDVSTTSFHFGWNGGFSTADPEALYQPLIQNPLYGYPSVNVAAQERVENSLLNWMRRLIRVRRSTAVFGRGDIRFLAPRNHRVLAFVRRFESDVVLTVNNLSGSAQAVELDLAEWKGAIPIEMFGGSLFPRVTERPYLLTLTPYAFLWFRLRWV